jgi:hypothetical protein
MKAEIKYQTQEDGDWILAEVEYDTVEHLAEMLPHVVKSAVDAGPSVFHEGKLISIKEWNELQAKN